MKPDGRLTQLGILFVPTLMFVDLRVIGQLYVPELLLLVLLPGLLLKRGYALQARLPRTILVLGAIWFASQVLTDVFRSTPFDDWSRGWAKIGFFLMEFGALYLLMRGSRTRMLLFATGIAVGQFLSYVIAPSEYALLEPWKFGYGPPVTLLAIVVVNLRPVRRHVSSQVGMLVAIAVVNLYMGSRSVFLLCLLVAAFVFMSRRSGIVHSEYARPRRRLWPAAAVVMMVALLAAIGYGYAAEYGWLGAQATQKYAAQSGGRYGVLLGGRVGVLASSQAIVDSPVLGHGSWAKDWKYQNLLDQRLAQLGYGGAPYLGEGVPPIPAHSYLLGAWVESGVLGAVFWAWILLITYRAARDSYGLDEPFTPLLAFAAATLVWNVLFSPFAAQERLYAALFIVVVLSFAKPTRTLRHAGIALRATSK